MTASPTYTGNRLLTAVREELAGLEPPDPGEARVRELALRALARDDQALFRSGARGHVTASVFVVDPAGRVLLTHHARYQRWLQLGGHLEPRDPSVAGAALREAQEESGLSDLRLVRGPVQVAGFPVPCPVPGSFHFDMRYLVLAPGGSVRISDESLELGWFRPEALPTDEPNVLAGARRAVAAASRLGHCPPPFGRSTPGSA